MSPLLPSPEPVLVTYSLAIGALLVAAGLLLTILSRGLGKDVSGPWRTYRGWLLMVPLILGPLWLGHQVTILAIGLLSIAAFKEFARATGLYRDWWYAIAVYLGIAAVTALVLVADPRTGAAGWYGMFMACPVYVVALLMVLPVVRNRAKGQLQWVSLSIVGFVYLGWMLGHLGFLTNSKHGLGYLLYLVFAVELNDIAAFTFGKLFGRRKLRSEISPNKTVAGSLGAIAVSMTLPWLLRFSFPHAASSSESAGSSAT